MLGSLQNTWSQVLNNETQISIDGKKRKKTERTILIQVNDKQENWVSHIEIKHSPLQKFSLKYAKILDPEGNILRKIRKNDLKTRNDLSYDTFYQDDLITEFDLYWHQYPYLIEYSYVIEEDEFLYVSWWTPILYRTLPTKKAILKVDAPSDYDVQVIQSGGITFNQSTLGNKKIYQWESAYSGKIEDENYSLPTKELIPKVEIIPKSIKYGVEGSFESWSSFGTWMDALNEGTGELTPRESLTVERLIRGITDKREIVKKLYYYLQDHTRYINVAIDVGGLKSYPASYVSDNKYGDCKALTTYMKSMLKKVGITSLFTLVNAGHNEATINRDFPGQQFNHVLLGVPVGKDTLWLENTTNSLPFNYVGTFTQNRYALAVNANQSTLVKTPKLLPPNVLEQRDYKFSMNGNGQWTMKTILNLRGGSFEKLRHLVVKQDEAGLKLQLLNNIGINDFKIKDWQNINFHRDSSVITFRIKGDISNPFREIGDWKVIRPLNITIPDFEKPGNRTLDVRINYPINKADKVSYKFKILEDSKVKIPEGFSIRSKYGQYESKLSKEGNSIISYEKFTLLDNEISIEEYPIFYGFIQSIINHQKKTAILIR